MAVREIYRLLYRAYGPQHWWPGETRTEIIVGAILTQNTAWTNVRRAIDQLKQRNLLSIDALHRVDESELAAVIRSAGTYRVKARRLKALIDLIHNRFHGDLDQMFSTPIDRLRPILLAVPGVGPETADAILLYAGHLPTFVVDAYTTRIFRRHHLIDDHHTYDDVKRICQDALPTDADLFGEYHALVVAVGKQHCKPTARCDHCPLRHLPHDESR